jgi:hypothetical protein
MSVTAWYRENYSEASTIEVVLPWRIGKGRPVAHVRPDYWSPFREACEALGVDLPRTFEERSQAVAEGIKKDIAEKSKSSMKKAIKRGTPLGQAKDLEPVLMSLARLEQLAGDDLPNRADLVADGWDLRYPIYLPEEIGKIAAAVGVHLVDRVEIREGEEGDGEVIAEWKPEEIRETFAESAPLPAAYPDGETVPMAGKPEGEAWATSILRAAVQRHRFQEEAAPLSSASNEQEPSEGT